jgi:galactokinase
MMQVEQNRRTHHASFSSLQRAEIMDTETMAMETMAMETTVMETTVMETTVTETTVTATTELRQKAVEKCARCIDEVMRNHTTF